MTPEEKRAFLVEMVEDMGLPSKLKQLFTQMISGTVMQMLPPEKGEEALRRASVIINDNLKWFVDRLVEHKAELHTDEEIEAMAQFHRSPLGRSIRAKALQETAVGEALGNEWFKTLMPLIEDAWDDLLDL